MRYLLTVYLLLNAFFLHAQDRWRIVVSKDGKGNYTSVQQAFDAIPVGNDDPVDIYIKKGIYKERLTLAKGKNFVRLIGEDPLNTILTYDNHTGTILSNGDTVNTYSSASFFIYADDFSAEGITFDNSAGFAAGQAVAVFAQGDKLYFKDCRFTGNQDVLFCSGEKSRQYYYKCYIEGTTDFIFGPSTALFEDCYIHSKKNSHITAASTPADEPYGFIFMNCRLTADTSLQNVSLGRPWRPYASVTYLYCHMGPHIIPEGWNNWKNPDNEKTARYTEYRSAGPGAAPSKRVPWSRQLTGREAKTFTWENIFPGWRLPSIRKILAAVK